jgi:hypothetical protein
MFRTLFEPFLSELSVAYALFNTSESVAKMVKKGLLAHIGAHGEPPLGLNYHTEMAFTQKGGLNNYEVRNFASLRHERFTYHETDRCYVQRHRLQQRRLECTRR